MGILEIEDYKLSNLKDSNTSYRNARLRWWLDCTQAGVSSCQNVPSPMRSSQLNLSFFERQCINIFGEHYFEADKFNVDLRDSKIYQNLANHTYGIFNIQPKANVALEKLKLNILNLLCPACSAQKFFEQKEEEDTQISRIQQEVTITLEKLIYSYSVPDV